MATAEKMLKNKKKMKITKENDSSNKIIGKKKSMKLSRLRKKRLIIRNLSFKINEEELKKIFSKFGEVLDVNIPLKADGKKKGFGFIEFSDTKSMIKAMKQLNFKKIHGRPVAIDFAVNKNTYLSHQRKDYPDSKQNSLKQEIKSEIDTGDSDDESIESSEENDLIDKVKSEIETEDSEDGESIECENELEESCDNVKAESAEDAKVKAFLKEFDVDDDELQESSENETSSESSEDEDDELIHSDEDDNHNDKMGTESKHYKKKQSDDTSEGKTVFIRNISFRNSEEELQEVVEQFGETMYCLFCNDPITGHFRGTAFVKFKNKESAEKLIEEASKEPGILLDGRKLLCSAAISREELSKQRDGSEKNRDKRNLRLLKCGLIAYGSKESEGVSQTDMAKRAQLEALKKQKLRNVNFFVSDKRLVCHNIPKNINDKDLYKMFKKAAGKDAVIKEARIMKDFKKTDAQGNPMSRGFAFITFSEHEHALKALNELNNNPNIFTINKRPIVEFSVENKVALLSQERRREKIKMMNKKRIEQQNDQYNQRTDDQQASEIENINLQKQMKQKKRKQSDINNSPNEASKAKKHRKHSNINSVTDKEASPKKKRKQKKNRKKQRQIKGVQEKSEISALKQMYKEKLCNKIY